MKAKKKNHNVDAEIEKIEQTLRVSCAKVKKSIHMVRVQTRRNSRKKFSMCLQKIGKHR